MNMFKPVKAKTSEEYFAALPPDRKEPMAFMDDFIRKVVPSLKPKFAYNMPGYGMFKYRNYKNEMIDWPVIALSNHKNYISLYVCSVVDGQYVAEAHKDKLGRVSVGKSCIRFKKIEDLNLDVLKQVLKIAEKNPSMEGVGATKKK